MRWIGTAASALLLVTTGCLSTANAVRVGETFPSRPGDWPVQVFLSEGVDVDLIRDLPDYRWEADIPPRAARIGRIDVQGNDFTSAVDVVRRAQNEARKLGGDGILIVSTEGIRALDAASIAVTVLRWK